MNAHSGDDDYTPLPAPPGVVEFALQVLKAPDGTYYLRGIKRTSTWFSVMDERKPVGRRLSLSDLMEVFSTLSDAAQSELISRSGVQLSLGGY